MKDKQNKNIFNFIEMKSTKPSQTKDLENGGSSGDESDDDPVKAMLRYSQSNSLSDIVEDSEEEILVYTSPPSPKIIKPDRFPCLKTSRSSIRKSIAWTVLCILISLLYLISENRENFDLISNTTYDSNDFSDSSDFSASMMTRKTYNYKWCDRYEFGCCKLYVNCEEEDNYLDFKEIKISFKSDNRIGSNCPSLQHLAERYNEHYKDPNTDCLATEFGCCSPINIGCDYTVRSAQGENSENIINQFNHNQDKSVSSEIAKEDEEGSNCWLNHKEYIYLAPEYHYDSYYSGNKEDRDSFSGWFLIVFIVFLGYLLASSH